MLTIYHMRFCLLILGVNVLLTVTGLLCFFVFFYSSFRILKHTAGFIQSHSLWPNKLDLFCVGCLELNTL